MGSRAQFDSLRLLGTHTWTHERHARTRQKLTLSNTGKYEWRADANARAGREPQRTLHTTTTLTSGFQQTAALMQTQHQTALSSLLSALTDTVLRCVSHFRVSTQQCPVRAVSSKSRAARAARATPRLTAPHSASRFSRTRTQRGAQPQDTPTATRDNSSQVTAAHHYSTYSYIS